MDASPFQKRWCIWGTVEMTLAEFAHLHDLPEKWLALRRECEAIARDPQFWSSPDLQTAARKLAVRASDILRDAITVSNAMRVAREIRL